MSDKEIIRSFVTAMADNGNIEKVDIYINPYVLANKYFSGDGVKKDTKKAISLYTEAAESGNHYAQATLGYLYDYGIGVEQNLADALKWYSKSVEQTNYTVKWLKENLKRDE